MSRSRAQSTAHNANLIQPQFTPDSTQPICLSADAEAAQRMCILKDISSQLEKDEANGTQWRCPVCDFANISLAKKHRYATSKLVCALCYHEMKDASPFSSERPERPTSRMLSLLSVARMFCGCRIILTAMSFVTHKADSQPPELTPPTTSPQQTKLQKSLATRTDWHRYLFQDTQEDVFIEWRGQELTKPSEDVFAPLYSRNFSIETNFVVLAGVDKPGEWFLVDVVSSGTVKHESGEKGDFRVPQGLKVWKAMVDRTNKKAQLGIDPSISASLCFTSACWEAGPGVVVTEGKEASKRHEQEAVDVDDDDDDEPPPSANALVLRHGSAGNTNSRPTSEGNNAPKQTSSLNQSGKYRRRSWASGYSDVLQTHESKDALHRIIPDAPKLSMLMDLMNESLQRKQVWILKQLAVLQPAWCQGHVTITVRRDPDHFLGDSIKQFLYGRDSMEPWNARCRLRVIFEGEPSIDAGGPLREYFTLSAKALAGAKTNKGVEIFVTDSLGCLAVNPLSSQTLSHAVFSRRRLAEIREKFGTDTEEYIAVEKEMQDAEYDSTFILDCFALCGRLIAKALMEQQTLALPLSPCLFKILLGVPIGLKDLYFQDELLAKNLSWTADKVLKAVNTEHNGTECNMSADAVLESMGLDWTVTTAWHEVIPLCSCRTTKKGEFKTACAVPVPRAEKELDKQTKNETQDKTHGQTDLEVISTFIKSRVRWHLIGAVSAQTYALVKAFHEIVPWWVVAPLDHTELQLLVAGRSTIDLDDWMASTEYLGGYAQKKANHPVVKWFWEAVRELSEGSRRRLLQFVTGSPQEPALGFVMLTSNDGIPCPFTIDAMPCARGSNPAMTAHTCFNKIALPMYKTKEQVVGNLAMIVALDATGFTME